jgi:hypothetical protein
VGDVVNLRRARKARERAEQDLRADANRRRFGRTKAERDQTETERSRAARDHEGKKLDS